jgi:hypothetical protein
MSDSLHPIRKINEFILYYAVIFPIRTDGAFRSSLGMKNATQKNAMARPLNWPPKLPHTHFIPTLRSEHR